MWLLIIISRMQCNCKGIVSDVTVGLEKGDPDHLYPAHLFRSAHLVCKVNLTPLIRVYMAIRELRVLVERQPLADFQLTLVTW